MLELHKIFLLVRFFNLISSKKGLKAKISCFCTWFFCLTPVGLECSRSRKTASFLTSHTLKNTKIHGVSRMERKRGKCRKSSIFEGKLQVFISYRYLSEIKVVCSITRLYYSPFYSLFLPFFVLEIFKFKFKYDKVFVRYSASISFEKPWRGGGEGRGRG